MIKRGIREKEQGFETKSNEMRCTNQGKERRKKRRGRGVGREDKEGEERKKEKTGRREKVEDGIFVIAAGCSHPGHRG